jgi:hypothetical protein
MEHNPHWQVIVRRDRADLTASLAQRYPDATVIVDRRDPESSHGADGRGLRPRAPIVLSEQVMWDELGYRLVYRPVVSRPAGGGDDAPTMVTTETAMPVDAVA